MNFVAKQDAVEWLRSLPSGSVDLCITDPPYESLEKHRAKGTTTRLKKSAASSNSWFDVFPNERFPELFAELYRVMKPNTHLYLFCDQETMFVAKPAGEAAGFKFWKPLVWSKLRTGMGYHYRASYEFILFFEKGKRRLNDLGVRDVLSYESIRSKCAYPTEKPIGPMRVLVAQSSVSGELVIDPFCGSGVVADASVRGERRFAGVDVSDDAVARTTARIAAAGGQLTPR